MGQKSGPKLLDLMIQKGNELMESCGTEKMNDAHGSSSIVSDNENKLELRLGLPYGDQDWSNSNNSSERNKQQQSSLISLNYGAGGVIGCGQEQKPIHGNHHHQQQQHHIWSTGGSCCSSVYLNNGKQMTVMGKDASQTCCTRMAELQCSENKPFSPPSVNTAVPNTSQKRAAPTPVVGWPPIRSFRKNLASSSSTKAVSELQNVNPSKAMNEKKPVTENSNKGLFVKINMDGVPIGRKVDLNAHNCYGNLTSAVDTLFRGLLAAQRDSSSGGIENKQEEQKPITGLLDGSGEYTLVYEDNEGDRMLVGDVPWHMFVSTVKRLRVLKSSDLPTLSRNGGKQGKMAAEGTLK